MKIDIIVNKVLHLFEVLRINTNGEKKVFLTFDDGPEEEITEFVLKQLHVHHARATFFCKGENAERLSGLYQMIISQGHAIGNHTYSHIHGFKKGTDEYFEDIEKADKVLHTHLFRPPWGALKLSQFLRIRRKYKIIYWSLVSGDTQLQKFDLTSNLSRLKQKTKKGDVVLFHCCKRHSNETKQILPEYLKWLDTNGYKTDILR